MLFLNLYVLAKSIILRSEAAVLHILVKPLGTKSPRNQGKSPRSTKEYRPEQVNI